MEGWCKGYILHNKVQYFPLKVILPGKSLAHSLRNDSSPPSHQAARRVKTPFPRAMRLPEDTHNSVRIHEQIKRAIFWEVTPNFRDAVNALMQGRHTEKRPMDSTCIVLKNAS